MQRARGTHTVSIYKISGHCMAEHYLNNNPLPTKHTYYVALDHVKDTKTKVPSSYPDAGQLTQYPCLMCISVAHSRVVGAWERCSQPRKMKRKPLLQHCRPPRDCGNEPMPVALPLHVLVAVTAYHGVSAHGLQDCQLRSVL